MSPLHLKSPPAESPPHLNGSPLPDPEANGSSAPRRLPSETRRGSRWPWIFLLLAVVLAGAGAASYAFLYTPNGERADVLLYQVKKVDLPVTVTEKGTLESAENRDVVCQVRAGSKGYASNINWVIDDGTLVHKNQLLMILDDSDFQDRYRDQKIKVDKALAAKLSADEQYLIVLKQNEIDIASSESNVSVAEINLEQYTGFKTDFTLIPLASIAGAVAMVAESGIFRQSFDDLTGKIRLAESDVEQNRERTAWAERMVKMRYMSSAQAQAERSKLESSIEALRSVQTQRQILADYTRRFELTTRLNVLDNARKVLDQQHKKAASSEIQADVARRAALSEYQQELEKLRDIEEQIRLCRIRAPQDGMVVYYKSESSSRFSGSSSNTGIIEQGAQVREGQKLLRIPDLRRMQVNTKIHEALVSRVHGDVRKPTFFFDYVRLGMFLNPNGLTRLTSLQDPNLELIRSKFRQREFVTDSQGQRATIRVDAMPDRLLPGHVRSVATIASQADFFSSDIKLYSTLVLLDDEVEGLKPDMTAEVTIHVDSARQQVLAIPLQSVIGGTEMGGTREVFVKANGTYEKREVKLGLSNDRLVEVVEGLHEGDEVVINPKVLLGDKAKTHDVEERPMRSDKGDPTKAKAKGKKAPPKKEAAEPMPQ